LKETEKFKTVHIGPDLFIPPEPHFAIQF